MYKLLRATTLLLGECLQVRVFLTWGQWLSADPSSVNLCLCRIKKWDWVFFFFFAQGSQRLLRSVIYHMSLPPLPTHPTNPIPTPLFIDKKDKWIQFTGRADTAWTHLNTAAQMKTRALDRLLHSRLQWKRTHLHRCCSYTILLLLLEKETLLPPPPPNYSPNLSFYLQFGAKPQV